MCALLNWVPQVEIHIILNKWVPSSEGKSRNVRLERGVWLRSAGGGRLAATRKGARIPVRHAAVGRASRLPVSTCNFMGKRDARPTAARVTGIRDGLAIRPTSALCQDASALFALP